MSLFGASALFFGGPNSTLVGNDASDEELRVAKTLVGSDASDEELRVAKMKVDAKLKEIREAVARKKAAEEITSTLTPESVGEIASTVTPVGISEDVTLEAAEEMTSSPTPDSISEDVTPEAAEDSISEDVIPEAAEDSISEDVTPEAAEDSISEDVTPEAAEEITSTPTPDSISEDEVAGSLLGGASAEVSTEEQVRVPRKPKAPGCYFWMPKGCPGQEMKSGTFNKLTAAAYDKKKWRHDTVGERQLNAIKDQEMCVVRRKRNFDKWCNHTDTRMAFVSVRAPTEGSMVSQPREAKMISADPRPWTNRFEPPPAPSAPGCYYWMPHGCPRQASEKGANLSSLVAQFSNSAWRHDTVGEEKEKAAELEEQCDTKRKAELNEWCGHNDTHMFFIAGSVLRRPKDGGCYFYQPDGCTGGNQQVGPDRLGIRPHRHWRTLLVDVGLDDTECLNRKAYYDEICDVPNTQMFYMPDEPFRPAEPGCYLWQPYGCPFEHSTAAPVAWEQDLLGGDSKAACWEREAMREKRCGDEARSYFVETPEVIGARIQARKDAKEEQKKARRLRQRQEDAKTIEQEFETYEAQEGVPATEGEPTAPAGSEEPVD